MVAISRCVPLLTGISPPPEFLGIDPVTHFGKIMGGSFIYSPARDIIASNLVYFACQATLPYHDGTLEIPLAAGAPKCCVFGNIPPSMRQQRFDKNA